MQCSGLEAAYCTSVVTISAGALFLNKLRVIKANRSNYNGREREFNEQCYTSDLSRQNGVFQCRRTLVFFALLIEDECSW